MYEKISLSYWGRQLAEFAALVSSRIGLNHQGNVPILQIMY